MISCVDRPAARPPRLPSWPTCCGSSPSCAGCWQPRRRLDLLTFESTEHTAFGTRANCIDDAVSRYLVDLAIARPRRPLLTQLSPKLRFQRGRRYACTERNFRG